MKKLLFVLFLYLFCNNSLFSALSGDGSYGSPYNGTVDSNISWMSGTVYVTNINILSGYTLTIGPGVTVITRSTGSMTISGTLDIQPGAAFTARGITNNSGGMLRLNSDAYGIASLIHTGYSGSGTTETEIYLTGGTTLSGAYRWHYVSSPVDGISTSVFTAGPTYVDFAQYVESLVNSTDNSTGWVGYDGWVYSSESYNHTYDLTTLALGNGYDYYYNANTTRTIIGGLLNYNNKDVTVTCGSGYLAYQGFNLIGNPFPSCFNWDAIVDDLPLEVDDAIYFTLNDGVASYVGGIGTGGGTGIIPPMQGFFIKVNTSTSGISLTLPTKAKIHDLSQPRYKGAPSNDKGTSTIPLVRLKFENKTDSDDLVIRFDPNATTAVDKKFDAYKFSKTGSAISTWSKTGNVDYSINGLPFPETSVEIPVGINTSTAGIYKLSSNELHNLDNYSVTLKDLSTNISVDLKKGEIMVFNAPGGITENRFVITVANLTTGFPDIIIPDKKFSIYSSSGYVNILSLTDKFNNIPGSVNIYDLTGRMVLQESNVEWQSNGDLKQIKLNSSEKGLFIVEIKAGNKRFVEKVNIQR